MYVVSLLMLCISFLANIPLARFIIMRPDCLDDDKYTKLIKINKLAFLFVSRAKEWQEKHELRLIEFLVQSIAYFCTVISLPLIILSFFSLIQNNNSNIFLILNFIFGLLFIATFVIIEMIYSLLTTIVFPIIYEIPRWKIKTTNIKIKVYQECLIDAFKKHDKKKLIELLHQKNICLMKRYANTDGYCYNFKTRKIYYYADRDLLIFCSSFVRIISSILSELNKENTDWEYLTDFVLKNIKSDN